MDSLTVGEALGRLRSRKLGEKIVYFYVVDADQRLVGVLPVGMMLSISESVSMQSMTLTLQTSTAAVSWPMLFRAVRRELPTAFGLRVSSGVSVVVISLMWKRQLPASLADGVVIIGAVLLASALGVILPAAVRALRAEPKIASGPIALALADIIALLLVFGMAQSFLG